MPAPTMNNAKKTLPTKGKGKGSDHCVECWGTHPNHKNYCSWSVGSRAAGFNIVAPDYQNEKDTKTEVNGGYTSINRHIANVWGIKTVPKTDNMVEGSETKGGSKAAGPDDWVAVEGDWVEI